MNLRPVTLREAKRYVGRFHRHNLPPNGHRFSVGLEEAGVLVGVAIASHPVSRMIDDGLTLEVTRVCTDGTKNANSMLYGAMARAAKALGYHRILTYTLENEDGASLRGAGWVAEGGVRSHSPAWNRRGKGLVDLFGVALVPHESKIRWCRQLVEKPVDLVIARG